MLAPTFNQCITFCLLSVLSIWPPTNVRSQAAPDTLELSKLAELSVKELLNVRVNVATKSESSIDRIPGIVTVIDWALIETTLARTLADMVRTISTCLSGSDFNHEKNKDQVLKILIKQNTILCAGS